ncbi:hypothetical protein [Pseudomonas sp.]|nr:hypothetical protein [Pseudomonas sp.]
MLRSFAFLSLRPGFQLRLGRRRSDPQKTDSDVGFFVPVEWPSS